MKRMFALLAAMAMLIGLAVSAQATLILRGTDSIGNRLIYDDDLNITWYDYTKSFPDTWQNQVNWADNLSVNFGGTIYNDWRLPTTVDGPYSTGYDGTTTAGYNIISSEMGHLYYSELGNLGIFDTFGNYQTDWGLVSTAPFQNLLAEAYWSGTKLAFISSYMFAWSFGFDNGLQGPDDAGGNYYAIAVRDGDVAPVPEPSTLLLLGSGILGIGFFARKRIKG